MDPIADMLTQIRNAQAVAKETVAIPFSQVKYQIAKILEKEGFVVGVKRRGRGPRRMLLVELKYEQARPMIAGLKKISRPGQRIYKSVKGLRPIGGGYRIVIVSTSKGLMTDKEARKKHLGGEVIAEIW